MCQIPLCRGDTLMYRFLRFKEQLNPITELRNYGITELLFDVAKQHKYKSLYQYGNAM